MFTRNRWFRLDRHDDPAPGALATDPTPTPTPAEPPALFDPAALSPEAKAYLQDQINKADLKARTTSKANAAQEARAAVLAEFAQKLGIDTGDTPPEPAELIQQAQADAWTSGTELQIHRIAPRLGADAEALIDSNTFRDMLDDLLGTDPRSPEFAAALEAKVAEAVEKNPKYKLATTAPAGPRPDPGQGGRPPVVTDFAKADKASFDAELAKYRLRPRTY